MLPVPIFRQKKPPHERQFIGVRYSRVAGLVTTATVFRDYKSFTGVTQDR